jgi:hypothetical protein
MRCWPASTSTSRSRMTRQLSEAFDIYDAAKRTKLLVQVRISRLQRPEVPPRPMTLSPGGTVGRLLWAQGSYCRNNPNGEWKLYAGAGSTERTVRLEDVARTGAQARMECGAVLPLGGKYWDYGTGNHRRLVATPPASADARTES